MTTEKAFDKAYSNVITSTMKIKSIEREISQGGFGGIDIDQLMSVKEHEESEFEIWSYILSLIEKNNTL